MSTTSADAAYQALALLTGQVDGLVEIRRAGDAALLIFRWPPHADLFGLWLPLVDEDRRLDWGDPAEDAAGWLDAVRVWLTEETDTGLLYRSRRRRVGDHIELSGPDWPSDRRFFVDVVTPDDDDAWLRTEFVAADGLDPTPAVAARDAGTLVAWVTAYEDNAAGSPYVGQAVVIGESATRSRLDLVDVVADAPITLLVEIIRHATHSAADAGATTVLTRLDLDQLDLLGFRPMPAGEWAVETTFLDEDVDAADALFEAASKDTGSWGADRDRAGRHLPRTRRGRLLHLLRYGRSGRRFRVCVTDDPVL